MDNKAFLGNPARMGAQELIDSLCREALQRQDPELIARINEVKGLYNGYDTVSHPDLADAVIVKLGLIVEYLLKNTSFDPYSVFMEKNQSDLIYFMQEQREFFDNADRRIWDVNEFVDRFDRYLVLREKKEQTRKIYRGKCKALLKNKKLPIRLNDLRDILCDTLAQNQNAPKKDHNLTSTIRNILDFLDELLR